LLLLLRREAADLNVQKLHLQYTYVYNGVSQLLKEDILVG